MRLIAISTAVGGAGLCLQEDDRRLQVWQGPARSGPGPLLAGVRGMLDAAGLKFTDLDGIAFGRGPGAFTGVRLGVALAHGLALGTGLPLVPVSDLAAVAWQGFRVHGWPRVLACLDARQGEIYWAGFTCTPAEILPITDEFLGSVRERPDAPGKWGWVGGGVPLLSGIADARLRDDSLRPSAEAVADLGMQALAAGRTVAPADAMPRYLRDRVAEPSPRHRHRRGLSPSRFGGASSE